MKRIRDSNLVAADQDHDFGLFAALVVAMPVGALVWGGIFWLLI